MRIWKILVFALRILWKMEIHIHYCVLQLFSLYIFISKSYDDNDYFNSNYDSCSEKLDKLVDNLGDIYVLNFSCYPSFEFPLRICLFDE